MPPLLPPYEKPVSAMSKRELVELCDRFDQPRDGTVIQLRTRMNIYLRNHREELEDNPQIARLYPRRHGRAPRNQPEPPNDDIDEDEQTEREEPQAQIPDNNQDDDNKDPADIWQPRQSCGPSLTPSQDSLRSRHSYHSQLSQNPISERQSSHRRSSTMRSTNEITNDTQSIPEIGTSSSFFFF